MKPQIVGNSHMQKVKFFRYSVICLMSLCGCSWSSWHVEGQEKASHLKTFCVALSFSPVATEMRRSSVSMISHSSFWCLYSTGNRFIIVQYKDCKALFCNYMELSYQHLPQPQTFDNTSLPCSNSHLRCVRQWIWEPHCAEWDAPTVADHRGWLCSRSPQQVLWPGNGRGRREGEYSSLVLFTLECL